MTTLLFSLLRPINKFRPMFSVGHAEVRLYSIQYQTSRLRNGNSRGSKQTFLKFIKPTLSIIFSDKILSLTLVRFKIQSQIFYRFSRVYPTHIGPRMDFRGQIKLQVVTFGRLKILFLNILDKFLHRFLEAEFKFSFCVKCFFIKNFKKNQIF